MIEDRLEKIRREEEELYLRVQEFALSLRFESVDAYTLHVAREGIKDLVRQHYAKGGKIYGPGDVPFQNWSDVPVNVGHDKVDGQYQLSIQVGF